MSDEAGVILIVTDDLHFSGQVSEQMLRMGLRRLYFARTQDALERARDLLPDLVLLHIPRGRLDAGWACYEVLQADSALASVPLLLYAPPLALAERAVAAPQGRPSAYQFAASDALAAQISSLIGASTAPRAYCVEPGVFPSGRDDL